MRGVLTELGSPPGRRSGLGHVHLFRVAPRTDRSRDPTRVARAPDGCGSGSPSWPGGPRNCGGSPAVGSHQVTWGDIARARSFTECVHGCVLERATYAALLAGVKDRGDRRRRRSVRPRGGSLQVRVYAGQDPLTGRDRYVTESVRGSDAAAVKRAEKVMTRLQADVDRQRAPRTAIPLRRVLAERLRTPEIEATTRRTDAGCIERTVEPAVDSIPVDRLSARNLETL